MDNRRIKGLLSRFQGAVVIFMVFDLTDRKSFEDLSKMREEIMSFALQEVIILIGNKVDLQKVRKVSWDDAKEFADRHNMFYIETSAKTGQGIQDALKIGAGAICYKKYQEFHIGKV